MSNIEVGSRVIYKFKHKGTVRFIGETCFLKGLLYGVELDTADGRMNGTINGVQYFSCKENYGIFVRLSQLSELIEDKAIEEKSIKDINEKVDIKNNKDNKDRQLNIPSLPPKSNGKENQATNLCTNPMQNSSKSDTRRHTLFTKPSILENIGESVNRTRLPKPNKIQHEISKIPFAVTDSKKSLENSLEFKNQEINDLKDQLETLKLLKRKDRENLIELNKSKKQLENELNDLNMKNKEIEKAKEKLFQEFSCYRESMKTVEEDIEIAVIDKEMAEEKLEQMSVDFQNLREQYDKAVALNEFFSNDQGSSHTKTLIDQTATIEKYQKVILDLTHSINNLKTVNENQESELAILREMRVYQEKEIENLKSTKVKHEQDLKDLEDRIDTTTQMEMIVENLIFKNDFLESEVKKLRKRSLELDSLADDRANFIEHQNIEIRKLHEEIECMNGIIFSLEEKLTKKHEEDEELTDQNVQLQTALNLLKAQLNELQNEINLKDEAIVKSQDHYRRLSMMAYVKRNDTRNDVLKGIEEKLKIIDLDQYKEHLHILYKYLPVTFSASNGESIVITQVLLVDRLFKKVALVLDHIIRQKRSQFVTGKFDEECEKYSLLNKLEFMLTEWKTILELIKFNLEICGPDILHNIALKYYLIMINHESNIDFLTNLIKKQCLEGTKNLNTLHGSIKFFKKFYFENFGSKMNDCNLKMNSFIMVTYKGIECLSHDLKWVEWLMKKNNITNNPFKEIVDELNSTSSNLQSKMKSALVYMQHRQYVEFNSSVSKSLEEIVLYLSTVLESVSDFAFEFSDEKILNKEVLTDLISKFGSYTDKINNVYEKDIVGTLKYVVSVSGNIVDSFESGEFDSIEKKTQEESSIDQCASGYRDKWLKLTQLPAKINQKEEQIKIVNKELHKKSEMLSEIELKNHYLNKKMQIEIESKTLEIEDLKKKLLPVENNLKTDQTEKITQLEFELEKMHLELSDAKTKMTNEIKEINYDDYSSQNKNLRDICNYLQKQLITYKAKHSEKCLEKLKPLNVTKIVKSPIKKLELLREEIFHAVSNIKITDVSSTKDTRRLIIKDHSFGNLRNDFHKLKNEYTNLNNRKNQIFLSPNSDNEYIGRIYISRSKEKTHSDKIVALDASSVKKIENIFQ